MSKFLKRLIDSLVAADRSLRALRGSRVQPAPGARRLGRGLKISILTVSSGNFLLLYPDNSGITCCYTKYFLVAISNDCLSIQNSNIRLSRIELSFWKVPWYHSALKILKYRFCYQADMLV